MPPSSALWTECCFRSSGYPEPERIIQLWEKQPGGGCNGISGANYLDGAKRAQSFESMSAITGTTMSYTGGGEVKSIRVGTVSALYFDVMGVTPALAGTFAKGEDQP